MSTKGSYHVQRTIVTTRQVYRSSDTDNGNQNQLTTVEHVTTISNGKKKEKKKSRFSCCGIPCGRSRKSSFDQDISSSDKVNKEKKKQSVSIIGKRSISTPSQSKRISLNDFRESCLALHNKRRQNHQAPKLVLSDKLNKIAQSWTEHMADTRTFGHSNNRNLGENIFFGQRSGESMTAEDVVNSWYDEEKLYSYSRSGFSSGTGHFTQMIWKNSKELGIGWVQTSDGSTYVVANYDPPGNIQGQFDENVLRSK